MLSIVGELDVRIALLNLRDLGGDRARRRSTSLAPFEREMEKATTGLPSRLAKVRGSAMPSVTVAEVVEPDLAPAGQGDRRRARSSTRALAGQRADGLLAAADLAAAAREVDIGGAQLAVDVGRRDAERQQPAGIESDADLAVDTADALDLRHAFHALQSRATASSTNQDSSSGVMAGRRAA